MVVTTPVAVSLVPDGDVAYVGFWLMFRTVIEVVPLQPVILVRGYADHAHIRLSGGVESRNQLVCRGLCRDYHYTDGHVLGGGRVAYRGGGVFVASCRIAACWIVACHAAIILLAYGCDQPQCLT